MFKDSEYSEKSQIGKTWKHNHRVNISCTCHMGPVPEINFDCLIDWLLRVQISRRKKVVVKGIFKQVEPHSPRMIVTVRLVTSSWQGQCDLIFGSQWRW